MPYATGTAASASALKSSIESFCVAHGWSLASNILSKSGSQSNVRLTSLYSDTGLQIEGANNSTFSSGVSAGWAQAAAPSASWPLTYHLFCFTNPDTVVCVLVHDAVYVKWLAFGDLVKVDPSAFTGGNWFGATYCSNMHGYIYLSATDIATNFGSVAGQTEGYVGGPGALFWEAAYAPSYGANYGNSLIHAEIDGKVWANNAINPIALPGSVTGIRSNLQLVYRGPNTWNGQAILTPIRVDFFALSNYLAYLGYIENIRHVRIDNYNLGDIITLGSDRWKVFPWIKKSTAQRDGGNTGSITAPTTDHSGTFGFAVRYDGA